MFRNKKTIMTIPRSQAFPTRMIKSAAIATGTVSDGRMIPVIVLDAAQRPDVVELIRVHEVLQIGDVKVNWAKFKWSKSGVTLVIHFVRPVDLYILIDFDAVSEMLLVDMILSAKAIYLQVGSDQDDAMASLEAKILLIEIPDVGFEEFWRNIRLQALTKCFQEQGMSHAGTRQAAMSIPEKIAMISDMRMLVSPADSGEEPED